MANYTHTVKSSGQLTSDTAVLAKAGWLYGVVVQGAGAVIIYDNASTNSGTVLWIGTGLATMASCIFSEPVRCEKGIFVDLTGNNVVVYYADAP